MKPSVKANLSAFRPDARLYLTLGIANWSVFVDHIPNNVVNLLTLRNFGFSCTLLRHKRLRLFVMHAGWPRLGSMIALLFAIRAPRRSNLDVSITRNFKLTERYALEFSAHATNALNHPQFGGSFASSGGYNAGLGAINVTAPTANNTNTQLGQGSGSSTFGTYGLSTYDPRQVELGLKLRF